METKQVYSVNCYICSVNCYIWWEDGTVYGILNRQKLILKKNISLTEAKREYPALKKAEIIFSE